MPNIVNVIQTDTFEKWRVKNNELGTVIGDLELVNSNSKAGEDTIVVTLNNLRYETTNNAGWIGDISTLFDGYNNLTDALNNAHADITTIAAVANIDVSSSSVSNYDGTGTCSNTTYATKATCEAASETWTASVDQNNDPIVGIIDILNYDHYRMNTHDTEIGTISSLYDYTNYPSIVTAANNLNSRLTDIEVDVGDWSTYSDFANDATIVAALNTIKGIHDNIQADFVNASGDTMTGDITFTSGGVQATGQYLNLGVGGTDTIRINTGHRVGIGKASHASYKVDVSGTLNATNLRIGGEQLDDRYLEVNTVSGVDEIDVPVKFKGNTVITGDVVIGTETIYHSASTFTETVQDISGTMFEGNTESGGIYASYSDSTGKVTLGISDDGHSHVIGNIDNFTENVQDIVGGMVSTNVESGINVTYDDSTGKVNFDVNDPTITLTGDVTGTATMSNLGSFSINTTVGSNNIALGTDTTGTYVGSGNTTGNGLSGSVSTEGGTFTVNSNATSSNTGNTIVFRDGSGDFSAGTITARATSANYADLAENYVADEQYPSGTVLSFGGESEVTQSSEDGDTRIIGVVSTNPAYLMHADCAGEFVVAVALTGRVLCGVSGSIKKGDMMVSDGTGRARASQSPTMGSVIGKALENSEGDNVIEVVVGKL